MKNAIVKNIVLVILAFAIIIGFFVAVKQVGASGASQPTCACVENNTNNSISSIAPEPIVEEEIIEEESPIVKKELLYEQELALEIMQQFFAKGLSYSEATAAMRKIEEDMTERYVKLIKEVTILSKDPYRPGPVWEYFTEAEWRTYMVYHYVSNLAQLLELGRDYGIIQEYVISLSDI